MSFIEEEYEGLTFSYYLIESKAFTEDEISEIETLTQIKI
jgi:hypothetical protein